MTVKAALLTEAQFLRQVVELAEIRHWSWLHLRPAMTRDSWRTPISGPLGKGFPDLLLLRGSQLIAVELKRDGAQTTSDQERVLELLAGAISVFTFRPADWSRVEAVLR